ncbi:hypothetical protein Vadar_010736 [Vaccinium darrowii]|uniref:Uncharacterized protein n=1 Tax=Vaccinium darrowii TaxID=229202 RepID=A0ACB7XH28_9ERIC|nr:hypothetical protein Vadar_010736 [Vaccinium darrowii]
MSRTELKPNQTKPSLSIRERRHAKSREAAARSVRGKAQAHKEWKSAKNAALNHVRGLQSQFSRTFSGRKTVTPSEELRILSQTEVEIDDDLHPITHASILSSSEQSSAAVGGKKMEPSGVVRGIHATEEGPDIRNDFEKEKAMQQENLTFSGVISMANNREIRKRLRIEVSFRDLTLTLKGKNKHLLRCVTGKIEPGRITAVMGPSGAGKTTFLSALVGKQLDAR